MPNKDYQISIAQNAIHKMTRWANQLEVLKDAAAEKENHGVASDCTTALKGLNGIINFYQNQLAKLEKELGMVEVPIEIKKPDRHLHLVKK